MKQIYFLAITLFALTSCTRLTDKFPDGDSQYQSFSPDGIPFVVADSSWKSDQIGNHRAVVTVQENAPVVIAELPWRRPDLNPESKKVKIVEASTGEEVKNVKVISLTSEKGTIAFEPIKDKNEYYIYYLPYNYRKGWNDARYGKPWNDYLPAQYEADDTWLSSISDNTITFPKAKVERFESRSRFDAFTSMGLIATKQEEDSLRNLYNQNPVVFVEDRAYPIRLPHNLPARWANRDNDAPFVGQAMKNEYYVWQLGLWAAHDAVNHVKLTFSNLSDGRNTISKEDITCFNQEAINWNGKPVVFDVNIPKGDIQAMWCGVQIPTNAPDGSYKGTVTVESDNNAPQTLPIEIKVVNKHIADKGDGDLWRHARLRWLNSTIGEDNKPVPPYGEMTIEEDKTIAATDKYLTLSPSGMPSSIKINNRYVLEQPMAFVVESKNGSIVFNAKNLDLKQEDDGLVSWKSSSKQDGISFLCDGYMEYDGYVNYVISLSSDSDMEVKDIKLVTSYTPYASKYFMGVGFKGGYRPESFKWNWEGPWDSYWMGNAYAGLHVEFRGGTYHGPLLNDYKPAPPASWANDSKGTIKESGKKGQSATVVASTGGCSITSEPKTFEFALLITPLKNLNPSKHFSERYYHSSPEGFDKAAEEGANIMNIHHAQSLNPVINYPFEVRDSLISFVNHEHDMGRKVKLYYTIRELTNHTVEIYALKSLNHEIFVSGVGYGLPWHMEHLIDDYKPAWYTELPGETADAALVLNGFSRWINYYLEGLRWMFENYKIDGIYMDDVSFDRNVMKRMRKIMAKYRPEALIDLHSNTGYSVGPANQYTDFFPYVNRLWFGESFRYNEMTPDEWFVTFSGIPFGQMSEMLQDGGNRFLGMIYGATARHSYGKFSPAPMWNLWKTFGIEDATMKGYWDEDCPVSTNNELIKATAYVKPDSVLISVGNFDGKERDAKLQIDWEALGLDKDKVKVYTPEVRDFQKYAVYDIDKPFKLNPKEGIILIIASEK